MVQLILYRTVKLIGIREVIWLFAETDYFLSKLQAAFTAFCPYFGKCNVNTKLFTFCFNKVKLCLGIGRECVDCNNTWKFVNIFDRVYMS